MTLRPLVPVWLLLLVLLPALAFAAEGARVGGAEVRLTGNALLTSEAPGESGPAFLNETLLAGVGALIVLVFVFASALALVPLLMAIVAIPLVILYEAGIIISSLFAKTGIRNAPTTP